MAAAARVTRAVVLMTVVRADESPTCSSRSVAPAVLCRRVMLTLEREMEGVTTQEAVLVNYQNPSCYVDSRRHAPRRGNAGNEPKDFLSLASQSACVANELAHSF